MPYATIDDITNRYGEDFLYTIADRDHDDSLDSSAVNKALADAAGLINSYVSTRYSLPLVKFPDLLTRLSVDIAVYWLSEDGGGATDEKRRRYEDALDWLGRIAKGKADIDVGEESTNDTQDGSEASDGVLIHSNPRLFTRNKLRGF